MAMAATGASDSRTSPRLLERPGRDPADAAAATWGEFVRRYRPRIHARCGEWEVQGADADDVAQEVMAGLIATMRESREAATRLGPPSAPSSWPSPRFPKAPQREIQD